MKNLRSRLSKPVFAAALLMTIAAGPVQAVENLGRLFLSPQQRQELDRRRQANIQEASVVVESRLTVNGQVSRSSGETTIWVNGVPETSRRRPRDPARVTLPGAGDASVSVKVGQTLDKVRGGISDPIGKGEILTPSDSRDARP
jgi:hypothetical protein